MGPHVHRPAPVAVQSRRQRFPDATVEAGRVAQQQRWPLTAEVVDLDLDAVGGGDAHGSRRQLGVMVWRILRSSPVLSSGTM